MGREAMQGCESRHAVHSSLNATTKNSDAALHVYLRLPEKDILETYLPPSPKEYEILTLIQAMCALYVCWQRGLMV